MMLLICPSLFIKKIGRIVVLADYGFIAILAYVIFIIYIFFKNVFYIKISFSNVILWDWNPSAAVGNFSLAFMIQGYIV